MVAWRTVWITGPYRVGKSHIRRDGHDLRMASKERPVDRGARAARRILVASGMEIRNARVASGLSLNEVGRAVRLSYSQVGRIERAEHPSASVVQLARIGSVVGLDIHVRFFPGASRLRDAAHIALLERFRVRLSPHLSFRTEVPLPDPGDQRAWDGMVLGAGDPAGVEAETRLSDIQALERRIALKARDGRVRRVILVVAGTRGNRLAMREAAQSLQIAFPVPGRVALQALAQGHDPGGSAIVVL
jgi:transcriptional regulator with XRE-family HTH domain